MSTAVCRTGWRGFVCSFVEVGWNMHRASSSVSGAMLKGSGGRNCFRSEHFADPIREIV